MGNSSTIFIAGSRDISLKRIHELYVRYIKKGNIVWGVYKEPSISGFEGQSHFNTLQKAKLEKYFDFLNYKSHEKDNVQIVEYSQHEEENVIDEFTPEKAIFIYGSWKRAFPKRNIYKKLNEKNIEFSLKSSFVDDAEARTYADQMFDILEREHNNLINNHRSQNIFEDDAFLSLADNIARRSFDYTWQTGAVLVKNDTVLLTGYNRVLPYETYIMHNGSLKEKGLGKFSEPHIHDLNVNDTLHAEMDILTQAINNAINIEGSTLYVSLMPCPTCARMIASTGIKKVVCRGEHFGGLAKDLFAQTDIELIVK